MVKEMRAKLLKHGVPKGMLVEFEAALTEQIAAPLRRRIKFLEQRELDSDDQALAWKTSYFRERDRAVAFELAESLRQEELEELRDKVKKQAAQIIELQKQMFGDISERGASRKKPGAEIEPKPESVDEGKKRGKRHGAKGHGRKQDKGLEPEIIDQDIEQEDKLCPCGGEYELTDLPPLESTVTQFLEKAVQLLIRRRKVLRCCKKCGKQGSIKTAKKLAQIIPRSKYSTEFWQFVLEEKFWLQRPTNRTRKKLMSMGIDARPGTLNNGLKLMHEARLFEVMYEAILERNRAAAQRGMDDTGWKVFADVEGKSSNRWYMWVSVTQDTTLFILDPRRSNEVICSLLDGVSAGIIVCDRHSSFKCFAEKYGFTLAFCWVHQRRDFIKLKEGYAEHADWAHSWLERIDALIAQNKVRVAAQGDEERFRTQDYILRQMVSQMKSDIDRGLRKRTLPKERRDELKSLEEHWAGLTVFVDHPSVPMDNNESERALREAVLARKSYYGSRAVWSGEFTSHLMTIYATLELNGINPGTWMSEYLKACAANDGLPLPDKQIQKFYPWNYKKRTPTDRASTPPEQGSGTPIEDTNAELTISIFAETYQPSLAKPHPS